VVRLGKDVTRRLVIAIRSDETSFVANELEKCGLRRRGTAPSSDENLRFLTMVLGVASGISSQKRLSEEMVTEIIDRTAGHADIFILTRLAERENFYADYAVSASELPNNLRDAITLNAYTKEVAAQIRQLDQKTLTSLLVFICKNDNVKILDCRFSIAVAQAVHKSMLVPDGILFGLLAGSLCKMPYMV